MPSRLTTTAGKLMFMPAPVELVANLAAKQAYKVGASGHL